MKKMLSVLLLVAILVAALPVSAQGASYQTVITRTQDAYENISIGGGGAMVTPLIDPTNPNRFYATCDMGGLYYSYDRGNSWNRTESYGWLTRACIAENGTVFAGGYGLYVSKDQGKSLELIYPKNVKYRVSRCGWNENLMLADDFNNGYLNAVAASADKVWFATTDWDGNFMLMQADHNGDNLLVFYRQQVQAGASTVTDVDMAVRGEELYYTFDGYLWKYDSVTNTVTKLYTAQGTLKDVAWVGDQLFVLEDTADATKILYTQDFENWNDLMEMNTLTNVYEKWGVQRTFNWHFKEISGNNFENIYLSFADGSEAGVVKFNGSAFEWVFDSMFKTRNTIVDDGWSYGSHGPFYGIATDPADDNFFLLTTETVYMIHYGGENDRSVKTSHCVAHADGTYSTRGLNVQTTYSVKEDPFDSDHIIICTTDLGLQNSYNNGKSFRRMALPENDQEIYNTCYDLYFDTYTEGLIYGLWSNRHDVPYNPQLTDRDWTKGAFAVSRDGGINWDFSYSTGLPADAIPVKMSVKDNGGTLTIAVATGNRGFFISYDSGKTFTSISGDMETVDGLIWGEDIVMTEDTIYCLTAPYNCVSGNWEPANLYAYDLHSGKTEEIDLGELVLVRSLNYHPEKGLYLNVIPTNHFGWFIEWDCGSWVNDNGGIYHYDGNDITCVFANNNGIFHSAFAPDGTLYATEPYGTVYAGKDGEFSVFAEGLFTQLKNISFSSDGDTMYVTCFGGGTYRMDIPAPEVETECTHAAQLQNEKAATCVESGYTGDEICAICGELLAEGQEIPALGHTEQLKNKRNPTCVGTGYTGDSYCTTCAEPLSQGEEIPALGHKTEVWNEKAATCTEAGYSGDVYCNTCGWLVSMGQSVPALGHTEQLRNEKAASCTGEGYTGDKVCATCGEVLSKGQSLPVLEHTTQWKSNGDETHLQYCTTCGTQLLTEGCTDKNGDSACDTCGYTFAVAEKTYSKKTSMTGGKSYVIVMSNKAMQMDLSAAAVTVSGRGTYTIAQSGDLTHWTYESGKLWCEEDGVRYYLYVDSAKRLAVTTDASSGATWKVSGSRLSTSVKTSSWFGRTTTYYLGVSGSKFAATTSKSTAVFYEVNN